MTVREIEQLVADADPAASHYYSQRHDRDFTVWREYALLPHTANDLHVEGWAFQIDRFTGTAYDPVAAAIRAALDAAKVAYSYRVDFEGTPTEFGLIHHIFDCQG